MKLELFFYEVLNVMLNSLKNRFQIEVIKQFAIFENCVNWRNEIKSSDIVEMVWFRF